MKVIAAKATPWFRASLAAIALVMLHAMAAPAQQANPSLDAGSLPRLDLSDAQKQIIFTSVTKQNFKNETPENFQALAGAVVPIGVTLEEMPKTIVELVPKTEAFRLARITNQVVIVDPQTRRVIEVIAGQQL